jgi:hypothetical protein
MKKTIGETMNEKVLNARADDDVLNDLADHRH